MTDHPFTLTIHMVASLDGIIAKFDNSISWFETSDYYEQGVEPGDIGEFLKTIDCYVMGAKTFEHALQLSHEHGWPYGEIPIIVLTHRQLITDKPTIRFYDGELSTLVNDHLKTQYRNVWVVGGALVTRDFIQQGLANEIRLTILPVLLGEGLRFCDQLGKDQALHLAATTAYKSGIVELRYEIRK